MDMEEWTCTQRASCLSYDPHEKQLALDRPFKGWSRVGNGVKDTMFRPSQGTPDTSTWDQRRRVVLLFPWPGMASSSSPRPCCFSMFDQAGFWGPSTCMGSSCQESTCEGLPIRMEASGTRLGWCAGQLCLGFVLQTLAGMLYSAIFTSKRIMGISRGSLLAGDSPLVSEWLAQPRLLATACRLEAVVPLAVVSCDGALSCCLAVRMVIGVEYLWTLLMSS